jgi:hypothetical protein
MGRLKDALVRRVRLRSAATALVGVVAGAVSARLALSATWYAFGDSSSRSALLGLAAGCALLGAGLAAPRVEPEWVTGALLPAEGSPGS